MKKLILPALAIFVLLGGLIMAFIATRQNQDIRRKAATPTGTATISLNPGSSTLVDSPGNQYIALDAHTTSQMVDGIQIVATISGTIPQDFVFQADTPPGMQIILNQFTVSGDTATLRFAVITQDTNVPFSG